mgnify:CR=1 FL=1
MLNISSIELESKYASFHPSWNTDAIHRIIDEFIRNCDSRLESSITSYVLYEQEVDFEYGEFSIYLIRALCNNCCYLDAVMLMNKYLQDSFKGKALILRRRGR